ncbi:hypothetical protein ABPG77_001839 [Micractinium sp. CCAP 211/92]
MADASLQSLLSTKAALDLGLVSQADFDAVKNAFLRAQQIKSALDVGLIKPEDYEETKQSFLGSLIGGGAAAVTAPAAAAAPPAAGAAARAPAEQASAALAAAPEPPAARPPPVAWTLPPPAPKVAAPAPAAPQPPVPAAAPVATERRPAANLGVPSNIPKMGGIKAQAQGTSMSGISVTEDAVNLFYLMRLKATYKWALWQVDDSGQSVIIAAVGDKGSSWDDFLAALPDADCRYGVYDFDFQTADGQTLHKMVFLNWAPDSARVKAKMMYASTKDFFKSHLDGLSLEFQASDREEVSEQEVGDAVRALKRG